VPEFLRHNGVAIVALLVALSGTAYAVERVTGAEVENDSLTGKDVDESTLKVTQLVARPKGDVDLIADPPPQESPPPQPPSDFGEIYPVSPDHFHLASPALVEVIGRVDARVQPPCSDGTAAAFVFIDGKHIAHVAIPVAENLPLPGAPVRGLTQFAPLNLHKGDHTIEVRVESVCNTNPGVAGEITAVRLGVIANSY
jgi:hypothetical protein